MYCIYKLTNPQNGFAYIGHTSNIKRRIYQHKRDLTVECKDFTIEVLFDNIPSRAESLEMEKVFVDIHNTYENGYNKTRGGGYQPMDDPNIKAKHKEISGAKTTKMNKTDKRRKQSAERLIEQNRSLEHRKKVSKATSEYNKKRWKDPEYRKKMSKMSKETWKKRKYNPLQLTLFD